MNQIFSIGTTFSYDKIDLNLNLDRANKAVDEDREPVYQKGAEITSDVNMLSIENYSSQDELAPNA